MFDSQQIMESIYKFTGKVKRDENGKVVLDERGNIEYEGGNPIWRKVYREAPPLAKRRLVMSWYYSMNKKEIVGNGELNDEFTKVKDAMDKTLGKADLEFLIENLKNNPKAVEHYAQLLENLPDDMQGGGQQQRPQEGEEGEERNGDRSQIAEGQQDDDSGEDAIDSQSRGEEPQTEAAQQQTV